MSKLKSLQDRANFLLRTVNDHIGDNDVDYTNNEINNKSSRIRNNNIKKSSRIRNNSDTYNYNNNNNNSDDDDNNNNIRTRGSSDSRLSVSNSEYSYSELSVTSPATISNHRRRASRLLVENDTVELIHGRLKGEKAHVAFIGGVNFAKGLWVGITFDRPLGNSNGTKKGVSYFKCKQNYGLFVKSTVLRLVENDEKLSDNNVPEFFDIDENNKNKNSDEDVEPSNAIYDISEKTGRINKNKKKKKKPIKEFFDLDTSNDSHDVSDNNQFAKRKTSSPKKKKAISPTNYIERKDKRSPNNNKRKSRHKYVNNNQEEESSNITEDNTNLSNQQRQQEALRKRLSNREASRSRIRRRVVRDELDRRARARSAHARRVRNHQLSNTVPITEEDQDLMRIRQRIAEIRKRREKRTQRRSSREKMTSPRSKKSSSSSTTTTTTTTNSSTTLKNRSPPKRNSKTIETIPEDTSTTSLSVQFDSTNDYSTNQNNSKSKRFMKKKSSRRAKSVGRKARTREIVSLPPATINNDKNDIKLGKHMTKRLAVSDWLRDSVAADAKFLEEEDDDDDDLFGTSNIERTMNGNMDDLDALNRSANTFSTSNAFKTNIAKAEILNRQRSHNRLNSIDYNMNDDEVDKLVRESLALTSRNEVDLMDSEDRHPDWIDGVLSRFSSEGREVNVRALSNSFHSNTKLVVFNLLGTLIDDEVRIQGEPYPYECSVYQKAMKAHGVHLFPQDIMHHIGKDRLSQVKGLLVEHGFVGGSDSFKSEVKYIGQSIINIYEKEAVNTLTNEVYGATTLLKYLKKKGISVIVTSNLPKNVIEEIVHSHFGKNLVDKCFSYDEFKEPRPHPTSIFGAMKSSRTHLPRDVVRVGATPFDIDDGSAAEIWTVGIVRGDNSKQLERVQRCSPDLLLSSLEDVEILLTDPKKLAKFGIRFQDRYQLKPKASARGESLR